VPRRKFAITDRFRRRRMSFAAVSLAATLMALVGTSARAQTTIDVPRTSGDQLVFFYDARAGRVPFLAVANPAATSVVIEVAFYPATLASRLGTAVFTLPGGGNVVIDPTQSSVAGGAANGNAGLAVVTPIASETDAQPIVPPEPLTGGYTLANVELAAAFGENPYGRLAVGGNGQRASAGAEVDGDAVRYQRFTPAVLMVPVYYNPSTLAPPEDDGNRVIIAAFNDSYGDEYNVTALSDTPPALFCDAGGFEAASGAPNVNGVLLSNLQEIAGSALTSSGKLFLDVNPGSGNVLGIFSQSLGTFAAGQRMPSVASVPDCPPPPSATPGPTPQQTPRPTDGGTVTQCPASGMVSGTISFAFDNPGGTINISGVTAVLGYDPPLSIPGCCANPEVLERITNLTGVSGGIFTAGDNDTDSDGVDDELAVGLVAIGSNIPAGNFARVLFDCTPGAALTAPLCGPDVTDDLGTQIDATCSLTFSN
jgi:hypothetical protein